MWTNGARDYSEHDAGSTASNGYNVRLQLTELPHEQNSSIPFTVAQRDGHARYAGVSEGAVLYLALPPGQYRFAAEINGLWQAMEIQSSASARQERLSLGALVGKSGAPLCRNAPLLASLRAYQIQFQQVVYSEPGYRCSE